MSLRNPLPTFRYAAAKVSTSLRKHYSPLRRSGEYFGLYKYPHGYSFSLYTPFCCPYSFLPHFICSFCRSAPLDRPPWLLGSPPQPNGSDPAPPRGRHHPLRKIHIDSFSERASKSITSHYSTARLSRNAISPLLKHSSTSPSRTVAGRHFVRPLFPIVREFHSNLSFKVGTTVFVQGRWVEFGAQAINHRWMTTV